MSVPFKVGGGIAMMCSCSFFFLISMGKEEPAILSLVGLGLVFLIGMLIYAIGALDEYVKGRQFLEAVIAHRKDKK
jgi:hypothetical protein